MITFLCLLYNLVLLGGSVWLVGWHGWKWPWVILAIMLTAHGSAEEK